MTIQNASTDTVKDRHFIPEPGVSGWMDSLSFGGWSVFALMESCNSANSFRLPVTQQILACGALNHSNMRVEDISSLLDGQSLHGPAREIWTAMDLRELCHLASKCIQWLWKFSLSVPLFACYDLPASENVYFQSSRNWLVFQVES